MSLHHDLSNLFARIQDAPWPGEREAFDRFLRRRRRRGQLMAGGVALALAVVMGVALALPGLWSNDVDQVVPITPPGTPMRIAEQGFELAAPAGWKIARKMTGPTPGFEVLPMNMGVALRPQSATPSGATITVTTDPREPSWQGASRRPDGRAFQLRPGSGRGKVGQYAIQWSSYCRRDPANVLIWTCSGPPQPRTLLITGYATGDAEARQQVQQAMQQIAMSVEPITNALAPLSIPTDRLQARVLLGKGGQGPTSWEAWLERRGGKPGFTLRFPHARPAPVSHWQELDPSTLNAQGTSSILQCLSWTPDRGVIIVGLARADTATVQIELNKQPLIQLPVFGRERSLPVVAYASPRLGPAMVLVNRITAVDAAGRMLGSENRQGRAPCNLPPASPKQPLSP
jgi:hypothetical protein